MKLKSFDMKYCYRLLIFALFMTNMAYAQVITKDDLKKKFKGKSLPEVKTILVDENKKIAGLINLSALSLKITPGKISNSKTTTSEKVTTTPKENVVKNFNQRLHKTSFKQKIIYPNTALGIDFSPTRLTYTVSDYDKYQFPAPTLKLKKVYFKDGKTSNFDQNLIDEDDDLINEIKGTKWIDSVALEANYYYPDDLSAIKLSAKNPAHKLAQGTINLVEINGNEVELTYSTALKAEIVKVEGVNANGKVVEQSSYSSSSSSSNFSTSFLQELYQSAEDAIAKIDKNAYKNVDEVVEDLYQKMPKEDKEKPENLAKASYSFRGNVTAIYIFFKSKGALNTYNFVLKNEAQQLNGFAIAQNKKGLKGILNENGKWLIEPKYQSLRNYKGNYFVGSLGEDDEQLTLWLDQANNKFVPFNYDFYHTDLYFDKYYFIRTTDKGLKGIINLNNQVVLEPIYDRLDVAGNYIFAESEDDKYIVFSKDLKEIMALNHRNFKAYGDYIFVDKEYTSSERFANYSVLSRTQDIYNKLGQKINKEDYVIDSYDFFGIDSLLLVQNKAGKKSFINTKGEVVLDASKYEDVSHFSNGLAPVKNKDKKWGYINTKGEIVIPFMYNSVKTFSKISAVVETEDGYQLIDHKNKIIKKFAQGFSSYSIKKDADNLEYRNYDKKTYNSKGEVVRE